MMAIEWYKLEAAAVVAGALGILGPLLAIGWWNGVSRRPAPPSLVKAFWLFGGICGGIVLAFGILAGIFHLHW